MGLIQDAKSIAKRDPAARGVLGVILLYPGFHALINFRVSHFFYGIHFYFIARWISQLADFSLVSRYIREQRSAKACLSITE